MTSRANEPMHACEITHTDPVYGVHGVAHPGITIREHAAIQIAAGLSADPQLETPIAPLAVRIADELMVELEKTR
tara:strand:- start:640 stop:864 length:225 start_codon:yes stop_codon:yes gene_type:complete